MRCKRFCELARSWVHFLHFLSCLLKHGWEKTRTAPSRADIVMGKCQRCWASAAGTDGAQHLQHTDCLTVHNRPASNEILLFTHIFLLSVFLSLFFFCLCPHPPSDICCDNTVSLQKSLLCSFIVPFYPGPALMSFALIGIQKRRWIISHT